jgi:hypothetical protein
VKPKPEDESGLDSFNRSLREYMDEKPKTVADGMFKGLLSIGSGVVQGITGVVVGFFLLCLPPSLPSILEFMKAGHHLFGEISRD